MEPKQSLIKLNSEQLDELYNYFIDTDLNLEDGLSHLELTIKQLESSSFDDIYSSIFKCDWCGYWYDTDEDCGNYCCYSCTMEDKDLSEDDKEFIDNADNALDDGDDA